MPLGIHPGFLVVLLIIVLVIFGPGKLPELGGAIGRGIREFRKESDKLLSEVKDSGTSETTAPTTSQPIQPVETETIKGDIEKSA